MGFACDACLSIACTLGVKRAVLSWHPCSPLATYRAFEEDNGKVRTLSAARALSSTAAALTTRDFSAGTSGLRCQRQPCRGRSLNAHRTNLEACTERQVPVRRRALIILTPPFSARFLHSGELAPPLARGKKKVTFFIKRIRRRPVHARAV